MLKCEIIGNLGSDCVVRDANGKKFAVCRVAHTDKWKGADGNVREETIWVDIMINDAESKVIPFLKRGTKVYVRGNLSLRVYSSPKDKCMKAGAQVQAWEIELCGGNADSFPRQLIDPTSAQLYDVEKFYWINKDTKGMKKDDFYNLVDQRGGQYIMNKQGFVAAVPENQEQPNEQINESES